MLIKELYPLVQTAFTPSRHAGRTRTVWRCRPVPALSELLPPFACVPRLGLPPASKTCCDKPTVESFHLHPVHGASWRTRTARPNDAGPLTATSTDRHVVAVLAIASGVLGANGTSVTLSTGEISVLSDAR